MDEDDDLGDFIERLKNVEDEPTARPRRKAPADGAAAPERRESARSDAYILELNTMTPVKYVTRDGVEITTTVARLDDAIADEKAQRGRPQR